MKQQSILRALAIAALSALPATLPAQFPVRFTLTAGPTPVVEGRFHSDYHRGVHAQVAAEREHALGQLGIRMEAAVHRFNRPMLSGIVSRSGRTTIPSVGAGLTLPVARADARIRPYLLASAGTFQTDLGGGREWHFGLSGGAGLQARLGPIRAVLEARLHQVNDGGTPRFLPVSVGVRF
jgi:hypothetical protein